MIRNIIFDLGNVLLSWKPGDFLLKSGYPPDEAGRVLETVFRSREWFSLDNGDITRSEAIDLIVSKSVFRREEIASFFNLSTRIIFPLEENVKVLPALKKEGFRLYYLSNYPLEFFNETKSIYDFFNFFDGGIISAEVKISKPDPAIYKTFLSKFSLDPKECLYIDDMEINVRSAGSVGISGIHFSENDSLEEILKKRLNKSFN